MKRPVDLGHCDFELSPLRLHFSATAYFTEAATGTGPSLGHTTISFSQWIDLRTLWVSQAPQLELRLFVSFDPMIKAAEPAFATELVREIGLPEVWSGPGAHSMPGFGEYTSRIYELQYHATARELPRTKVPGAIALRPPETVSIGRAPEP
ncbi:unnamed protein product [Penicillium roqueforti FM164]|uniref:Uncharacterized protein n=1 Tax=Penicillium roqueforti (strain FM164) TaxID=1365484 RepID=W6QNJ8_PENRF|nr:unnamed protein product [Penicillium roqueforti FM164]